MCGVFLEGYIHIRPLKNISLFLPVEFEAVILIQNVLYSPKMLTLNVECN